MNATNPNVENLNNVAQVIESKFKANPNGGEIVLDELENTLKLDRHSVLEQARGLGNKFFLCYGRKGGKSRVVWGDKTPAHVNINKKHNSPRKRVEPTIVQKSSGLNFELRINVGNDQVKNVPIHLELAAA